METKRKRRWFQFHLSTALVLTPLLSLLLWSNLRPPRIIPVRQQGSDLFIEVQSSGWPFSMTTKVGGAINIVEHPDYERGIGPKLIEGIQLLDGRPQHPIQYIVYNACISIAILVIVAFGSEWWIRRRHSGERMTL
jgi:hypothetical protein